MIQNKELRRLTLLKAILRENKAYGITLPELHFQLNTRLQDEFQSAPVSQRTLESSLQKLRSELGLEIAVDRRNKQFRYIWNGLSESGLHEQLDEEERLTLPVLFGLLNKQQELDAMSWLKNRLTTDYGFDESELENESYFSIAQPEIQQHTKVLRLCGRLIDYMKKGVAVQFEYKTVGGTGKKSIHIVAPLQIRLYDNRYYLAAVTWNEGTYRASISIFSIDQIRNYTVTDGLDDRDELKDPSIITFDHSLLSKKCGLKNHFKHCIGIWKPKDGKPEHVRIVFSDWAKSYVKNKKLHATQRIITENEHSVTVEIIVYRGHELDFQLGKFREFARLL